MNIIKKNSTLKTYPTYNNSYSNWHLLLSICITLALGYNSSVHSLHGISRAHTHTNTQTHVPTQQSAQHTQQLNQNTPSIDNTASNSADKPSIRVRIKNSIIQSMNSVWRTIYEFFWTDSEQNTATTFSSNPSLHSPYTQSYTPSYPQTYNQTYTPSHGPSPAQSYPHYPQQAYQASYGGQNYTQQNTRFYAQPKYTQQQTTGSRHAAHNQSRAQRQSAPQQSHTPQQTSANHHHRLGRQSPQAPTPITHRFRQYQLQATNQRDLTCGLHTAANAQSIQRCVSMGHAITAASVTQHHALFYAQGTQFVGHLNNLVDNDIMRLVHTRFGMNNCCVISMDKNICYTTYQSVQDIAWGVPDYSGPAFNNNAIKAMVNHLKNSGNGAVHFICHISDNTEHWVLISLIKERNQNQYAIAYMDSQNRPLAQRVQAQQYINLLCEHYFTPLLG